MKYAVLSDRGLVRPTNQDAYMVMDSAAAVADGMGGHEAGEVASHLAIAEAGRLLAGNPRRPKAALTKAFAAANAAVRKASRPPDRAAMGSTLTAVLVQSGRAWVGHVGDSRVYLLREGKLEQLTEDHSLVADLVKSGTLSAEEARTHPRRHVITRAVGSHMVIRPDIFSLPVLPGDRLILCTDGLTNHVDGRGLAKLAGETDLPSACRKLVEAAKTGGGSDNITVIIIDAVPREPGPARTGQTPRRRLWPAVPAVLVGLVLAAGLIGRGLSHTYYLAETRGRVAVWRGLPGTAAGFRLGRLDRITAIQGHRLPAYYRRRLVRGLVVGDARHLKQALADVSKLAGRDKRGRIE